MADASYPSLKIELAKLQDAQLAALEESTFISMNERQKRNYDERAAVIHRDRWDWPTAQSVIDALNSSAVSAEQHEVIYVLLIGAATLTLLFIVWAACLW